MERSGLAVGSAARKDGKYDDGCGVVIVGKGHAPITSAASIRSPVPRSSCSTCRRACSAQTTDRFTGHADAYAPPRRRRSGQRRHRRARQRHRRPPPGSVLPAGASRPGQEHGGRDRSTRPTHVRPPGSRSQGAHQRGRDVGCASACLLLSDLLLDRLCRAGIRCRAGRSRRSLVG